MSRSPYSFIAFIDESGDEGFKIRQFPERGSSEWFVISAIIFRASEWALQSRTITQALGPFEENGRRIHFADLSHEQRLLVFDAIGKCPGIASSVCIHKAGFDGRQHGLNQDRRLYFYTTRMLLERISWYARDHRVAGDGNGKAKLVFAHCKSLSYEKLKAYIRLLRDSDAVIRETKIAWDHIETDNVTVQQHKDNLGLRLADSVSSGVRAGLELTPYGFCEERYARLLRPRTYSRNGNYRSYGLKFFPRPPEIEPERDNRYAWIYTLY